MTGNNGGVNDTVGNFYEAAKSTTSTLQEPEWEERDNRAVDTFVLFYFTNFLFGFFETYWGMTLDKN